MKLSLQSKWFVGLAVLMCALLGAVVVGLDAILPGYLTERIRDDLTRMVQLAGDARDLTRDAHGDLEALAVRMGRETGLRVTFISPDGRVVGESELPATGLEGMENHLGRPEVQEALRAGVGYATRASATLGVELMYAACARPDRSVTRVAIPLTQVRATTRHAARTVAAVSLIVTLLALPFVFALSRRISRPIEEMCGMARRAADGDFTQRAPERGGAELAALGAALNRMSDQLRQRLQEVASEKAELQATLSTMVEGVMAVDLDCRVRLVNESLRRLFSLVGDSAGRTVMEIFRHLPLQELLDQVLAGRPANALEMSYLGQEERVFDVTAARLTGGDGQARGAVVVFHDITRIRKLERVRREFVANASHELRTPLSVIRGYVETLLEEPPPDAATARGFLSAMDRNVRRLESLMRDLLSISELESQQARLSIGPVVLRELAADAAGELGRLAQERGGTVTLDFPDDLPTATADEDRVHQVFTNLIENALKYSGPGGRVRVSARAEGAQLVVSVSDNGPGIAPEHLTRIFERFYRVDKARSRALGGTGLGLSIVKHIVHAQGGRVWAESRPGEGSTFYFTLPQAPAPPEQ